MTPMQPTMAAMTQPQTRTIQSNSVTNNMTNVAQTRPSTYQTPTYIVNQPLTPTYSASYGAQ